jgi:hypothetical protein
MEPASDGALGHMHNEMAAVRQEEDSQHIADQKKADERFEQYRKSRLDDFDASTKKLEKERQAEFAASMTALTAKHHEEIVNLENVHKGQLRREQQKWERVKLQSYRINEDARASLEEMLEEQWQQCLRATVQGRQNMDGKRDIKDHSIGNRLLTDSVADTDLGKSAQQQSPSRSLLARQPIQVLNVPYNNHPPAPLESPPKRQRLQRAEKFLKPEENDLDDSPTKQLYDIPVYPSSGVSTPQYSPAKPLYSSPAYIGAGPRIPQYSPAQLRYSSPAYPLYGPPIQQQLQTTALRHLPSMNPLYAGPGLPISHHWHARPLGNLSSAPHYTSYGLPILNFLQPSSIHNNPICTKPGIPDQQGDFYSIKAFRCGPTTWPAAVTQPSLEVKATMALRPDHN